MRSIVVFAAAAALAAGVVAQSDKDHAVHHPDGASAPASAAKKAPAKAKPKAVATAASAGMGSDMQQMHDQMHKPGGMHDQMHDKMHGKDGKMMGGQPPMAPAASAASR